MYEIGARFKQDSTRAEHERLLTLCKSPYKLS